MKQNKIISCQRYNEENIKCTKEAQHYFECEHNKFNYVFESHKAVCSDCYLLVINEQNPLFYPDKEISRNDFLKLIK